MKVQPSWRRIAPGMYVDEDHDVHLDPKEALEHFKMPYTLENYNWFIGMMQLITADMPVRYVFGAKPWAASSTDPGHRPD